MSKCSLWGQGVRGGVQGKQKGQTRGKGKAAAADVLLRPNPTQCLPRT